MIKNTAIAVVAVILLISCYSSKAPAAKLGMSAAEFKELAKFEELVSMDEDWTVYIVPYGYSQSRIGYYYFKNDKLVRMDSRAARENYRLTLENR
ncbi:hypothetical protein [Zunongwangia sp. H14]|uniref:hypothetical protein n=1 Tax=Zunongwangia sp. H14 TaxID=3240792 RepID=UPI00356B0BFB